MTLEEMIELSAVFRRLAATEGAVFSETATTCRVDQVSAVSADDLKRIVRLAALLLQGNLGTLAVFGAISGEIVLDGESQPGISDEAISVRLLKKAKSNSAYFVTLDGFSAALGDADFMMDAQTIWIADNFLPFATQACVYAPWGSAIASKSSDDRFDSPRRLVRDESYRLTPSDVRPWYLTIPGDEESSAFAAWKEQAVRSLVFCLPTEIRSSAQSVQVVLKGARSAFADIDLAQPHSQLFNLVTDAVRWVFDQRRDTETKFHLLNNHLALYWPDGAKWPSGLGVVLGHALASAREAFAFHLQDDSKEAIKTLGDLRKALQEEVTRSQTATRDLLSSLWRDAAIAGAAFALRFTTTSSTASNLVSLGVAVLLLISLMSTILSNFAFNILANDVRSQWRKRLYAFMSETQWNELVIVPISQARWVYRVSIVPVAIVYVFLIAGLLWVAFPSDAGQVSQYVLNVLSSLGQLAAEFWQRLQPPASIPSPQ